MKTTAILVDGGYILKGSRECFGRRKFNYADTLMYVNADGNLSEALYYDCKPYLSNQPTDEELDHRTRCENFFSYLETLGFKCKFGKLKQCFNADGKIFFKQKQVDNLITIDLINLSAEGLIKDVKLAAGDADFVPAVKEIQNKGVNVELFYFPGSTSRELLQTVDVATAITSDWMI